MAHPAPIEPGPGQESVWDYPRPPRVEESASLVEIELGGRVIARTERSWRVLETSHPPTYYVPRAAFEPGVLRKIDGSTWCEWKGRAAYFDLVVESPTGEEVTASRAAWTYPEPAPGFEVLLGTVAVMPRSVDRCAVDGETVVPQPGGFYGGWITGAVVGPFKGDPGTLGW